MKLISSFTVKWDFINNFVYQTTKSTLQWIINIFGDIQKGIYLFRLLLMKSKK